MSIEIKKIQIEKSTSIISFTKSWDRFLLIEKEPAYHIGNICGTCEFFFERLKGANKSFSIDEIRKDLYEGIFNLESDTIDKFKLILPNGDYYSAILEINPYKVSLGEQTDYFANEQIKTSGIDGFWNLPHYPKIEYYRNSTKQISETAKFFEFIVPMFPENWLKKETIESYKKQIENDQKPTAVSISILDIKEPEIINEGGELYAHWCLSHYLIDGHHKVFASNLLKKPISLLSFLAVNESIADEEEIKRLFTIL